MNVLELFAGIGGLGLGLERAGMTVVGQVEIDPFCRAVLDAHWPEVPKHDDVRTAVDWWLAEPRPRVDVIAGGFPCQGHSVAGRQRGTADERWGWPWFRDVVEGLSPPIILIENVPNLTRTGLLDVLEDLAHLGFDAWWSRVPAAAVGAPHLRWRLFVIAAHAERVELRDEPGWSRGADREDPTVTGHDGAAWALADTSSATRRPEARDANGGTGGEEIPARPPEPGRRSSTLANADSQRCSERAQRDGEPQAGVKASQWHDAVRRNWITTGDWPAEPDVGRVAHGVPQRVDRLRTLGNAVVPAVGEYVGCLLLSGLCRE
jgi:DNA (cytosine-5)-methyltransferase 1